MLPSSDEVTGEVYHTDLRPDLVVIDRHTNHVHIFVISIADESEMPEAQRRVLEQYYDLVSHIQIGEVHK